MGGEASDQAASHSSRRPGDAAGVRGSWVPLGEDVLPSQTQHSGAALLAALE